MFKVDTGSVFFADTAFLTHGTSEKGLALAQWDYDGHEVAIYPLHSSHPKSIPGHILLLDTALYITGNSFNTPTSFGNIPCGMGQYIAKLVDTSMRSPYLYPDLHADQSIIWPGSDTLRIPHPETNPDLPLNATASSGLPVVYSLSDPSMALVRIDNDNMKLAAQCQRGVCQITATQPGTSYWNPASRTKTLIIGPMPQPPAAIDEPSTLNSQFSIYPNPVTDAVTLSSPEPLLSVHLTDLTGRKISTNALTQSSTNAITLDLSPLPQATYLLTLTTATGKTHTVKLLKISPLHP